ncbi:MAG: bifunctional riboflavin kinase/FAD synthetase [Pseudomonas sp.]|jgi:riboflavin kinase/FMN adenylyltransferase|nr:bifunctional riboflavin kinase/FAD synthetase [Pseudomonas sp.]
MQLVRGLHNVRPAHHGCVATIGNFDGVHLGHQAILTRLRDSAARLNLPSCVIVFEPQPREFFNPDTAPVRLTRLRDKLQLFTEAGIDQVLCIAFNKRFRQLSAEDFVQTVLLDALGIKHLQVGDDFRFGCDRVGDFSFLQEAGQRCGFSVEPTATVEMQGQRVSSTWLRAALAGADFGLARRLLGRPYSIDGRVMHGKKLGRTLNAPTANVQLKRHRAPLHGVYLVTAQLGNGRHVPGVANIGTRPTVNSSQQAHLEVHLLDFSGDLYGQHLAVTFHKKIRDEQRFESLPQLQEAIAADIAKAHTLWQHFHTL